MSTVADSVGAGVVAALRERYHQMRADLLALQAQSVKDIQAIDKLVDALGQLEIRVKDELGIRGNKPKG